jgi:L-fucose mutarotase/ribose pyranase (RbsD/FucU family)
VLGLEVVLPDGQILETGGRCHKNKTGLDLIGMFVGSEGLLGVITKATLRLIPHPEARAMLTATFPDFETAAEAVQAVLSVLPLDTFVDDFAGRMEIVGDARSIPPVQAEVQAEIDAAEGRPRPMISIERFAFYDVARKAYAVIQTGERRFYGCFMLRKGVIGPEE